MQKNVGAALAAEFTGTALVLFSLVASSTAAEWISPGNDGFGLIATAAATVLALYFATLVVGPASGGHFNPLVTIAVALDGEWSPHDRVPLTVLFILAQGGGAIVGAALANFAFGLELVQISPNESGGVVASLGEAAAAAGLVMLALLARGRRDLLLPAYSVLAYVITSSHSLANPAIVLGRMCSSGFAGLAPESGLLAIAALLAGGAVGGLLAWCAERWTRHA